MRRQKTSEEVEAERENLRRLYLAIGQFVFAFSQLEFMIRHLLGEALGLNEDRFYAVTSPYDFAALCRVTQNVARTIPSCTDEDRSELDDIFKECLKVNDDRVRIVHGTWFISEEEGLGTRHISRTSLEPRVYYSRIEEIDALSSRAAKLKSRIVEFLIGPRSSWPEIAAQLHPSR
jgi:hypothetical protein